MAHATGLFHATLPVNDLARAEAFYRGPLARALARGVQERGGWLTEADLAGYAAAWGTPLAGRFRGHEVLIPPPPTNAVQAVQTLHIGRQQRVL